MLKFDPVCGGCEEMCFMACTMRALFHADSLLFNEWFQVKVYSIKVIQYLDQALIFSQ